ncbi:hypothetical protein HID58_069270 [Brassica napus]|uniref:Uncharacterized protein n=1 Tax=Brassica napus TaxID=3708 RepID=A0ABQ7YVI5_BRANA|nr:hypothetical protein HID58_069270 [Brassica napus]
MGNVVRLPVSVVCDEYQKAKARKRHLSYTPRPRLVRDALSANASARWALMKEWLEKLVEHWNQE